MEQLDPAARDAPQALAPAVSAKSVGFEPAMLGTMLLSGAVPVFDNDADRADEVAPTAVVGKLRGEVSEATGAEAGPIEIELLVTAVNPLAVADSV